MTGKIEKSKLWWGMAFVLIAGILIGFFASSAMKPEIKEMKGFIELSIDEKRERWINEADMIRNELKDQGKYSCCLEKPCWYCIYKTPKHGEGATCTCGKDLLAGKKVCGECLGEFLEGHGDPAYVDAFKKVYPELADFIDRIYIGGEELFD